MADGLRKDCLFTYNFVFFILACSISAGDSRSRITCVDQCASIKQTTQGKECVADCCKGWSRSSTGNCTIRQSQDYQPPTIIGCPRPGEHIKVEIGPYNNTGFLNRWTFRAYDWEGNALHVGLSKYNFSHCKCAFPYENVTATTEKDKFGNQAVCNFSVVTADSYKPRIKNCPEIQHKYDDDLITWDSPTVTDNVGVQFLITPDRLNNTRFIAGQHHLFYNATDYSGNTASCAFTITITSIVFIDEYHNQENTGYLVSTISGAIIIVLIVLAIAVFGIFRRYRRLSRRQLQQLQEEDRRRQCQSVNPTSYATDAFPVHNSIYENCFDSYGAAPPPYDVITRDKPPAYSPPLEPPPYSERDIHLSVIGGRPFFNSQTFDNQVVSQNTNSTLEPSSSSVISCNPTQFNSLQSNLSRTETSV